MSSRQDKRLSEMSEPTGLSACEQAADPHELSLADFGKRLDQAKSVLERQQEELNSVKESFRATTAKTRSPLGFNLDLGTFRSICSADLSDLVGMCKLKRSESLAEMEEFYKVSLQRAGLAEMEEHYKEKLKEESHTKNVNYRLQRCARHAAEEEMKSFKDRVAGKVGLALKTGNSESMNDPVNETRLKEMYEDLWKQWQTIKSHVQSVCRNPEEVRAVIRNQFQHAAKEMEEKKSHIEIAFNMNDSSSQKIIEYKKLSIQNLQLAMFHSRKDDTAAQKDENREAVINNFLSKYNWLSCLLALNNPPLQPDWEHHDPGMDAWNVFPENIRAASSMERKQIQQ